METLGYLFGKKVEAEEFLNFYQGCMNTIKGKVEVLSEEDKTKVYYESRRARYRAVGPRSGSYQMLLFAGGKPIFEMGGNVDPEEVMERDPDVIVKSARKFGGYDLDVGDTKELEEVWEEMNSRYELQNVSAVTNGRVYVITWHMTGGGKNFLGVAYEAKWYYPELFTDLNPKALHQEYLTRFQGLDIDLDEKGVFVYHPEEYPEGQ